MASRDLIPKVKPLEKWKKKYDCLEICNGYMVCSLCVKHEETVRLMSGNKKNCEKLINF